MQHLPLPATRTAHPLGGWHRRGSPSSLHARVVRTSTVEISVQQAISSCPLTALFFQSLKEMDSRTEHYAFWNLFILDYFLIICISELKKICCLLHGLCERRKMLCTPAALRQRLAKRSGRARAHCNAGGVWRHKVIAVWWSFHCAGFCLWHLSSVFRGWEIHVTV